MERCTSCQFYDRHKGNGDTKTGAAGLCRRAAPHLSPVNQKTYMIEGVWPTVRDDDWCGEWKSMARRVDPARLTEVLGSPLPTAFPAAGSGPRPLTPPPARPAFGALGADHRNGPTTIAPLPGMPGLARNDN